MKDNVGTRRWSLALHRGRMLAGKLVAPRAGSRQTPCSDVSRSLPELCHPPEVVLL
jgi:hypothetical protein